MNRIEELEREIEKLTPSELAAFREWFDRYDNELWDRQLDADAKNGKLERLAQDAIRDHQAGRSTEL
jgi:hypothetical protein